MQDLPSPNPPTEAKDQEEHGGAAQGGSRAAPARAAALPSVVGAKVRLLNARGAIFALNCYLASILALAIAFSLNLSNPWWALLTVFFTSQPLAGAIWARALYRVVGTLIGLVGALLIIPNLSDSGELLILALAAWIAVCVYGSLLDRTPRSYAFALSGYTVALVGLPLATNPILTFDAAVARGEEIVIGVLAAAIVHSLLFPLPVAAVYRARLTATMSNARQWIAEALSQAGGASDSPAAQRIAIDLTELSLMASNLRFEGELASERGRVLRALEDRMVELLPYASAIEDRRAALEEAGPVPPAIKDLMATVAAWLQAAKAGEPDKTERLVVKIRALMPAADPGSTWRDILTISLTTRLAELVVSWDACLTLAAALAAPDRPGPAVRPFLQTGRRRPLHIDHGVAALSAVTAALAVIACAVFTVATNWSNGPTAVGIAAVLCALFAAADDPTPTVRTFLVWDVIAVPLSALYVFAVLPAIDGFPMLALSLFPILWVIGLFLADPRYFTRALPAAIGVCSGLALQPNFQPDFISFANLNLALVVGAAAGLVAIGLVRSLSVERAAQRILRAGWRELVMLTRTPRLPLRHVWASRMLDRLGLLIPRLAHASAVPELALADALRDLRIGVGIVELRHLHAQLDHVARERIDTMLAGVATHFHALAAGHRHDLPASFVDHIDEAIAGLLRLDEPQARSAGLVAAVTLRRNLFPQAPGYLPRQVQVQA